jgi:hypothetical protein
MAPPTRTNPIPGLTEAIELKSAGLSHFAVHTRAKGPGWSADDVDTQTHVLGRSRIWRRVRDRRSARVEERRDQREHFAGPPDHADVRGPGDHRQLRVRQELEHLHHVRQR